MLKTFLITTLSIILILSIVYRETIVRLYHGFQTYQVSKDRAKYYELDNQNIQDITEKIILDKSIPGNLKEALVSGHRRIMIFKYLSGSNWVAGYLSYITKGDHPLMIFLRGGNGYFGIMRPNNRFSFLEGYNVVGTLYRGNIYGGTDELGGEDVQDVENLINFFPQLEKVTKTPLQPPYGMIGVSRGAMEMFAALSRSDYIKERVTHAISVSGNVDLNLSMDQRLEMKYLFQKKFKQSTEKDFKNWINYRDPIFNAPKLSKSLKVLLVYGSCDNRVYLEEQENLKDALDRACISNQLFIFPEASHGLEDHFEEFEKILDEFMKKI